MTQAEPKPIFVERSMVLGQGDEVLFVQRALDDAHEPGLWELPGGKVDPGEDAEDGRFREIFEETGLITAMIYHDLVDVQEDTILHRSGELRTYHARTTVAKRIGGVLDLSHEHVNAAMMPPAEALSRLQLTNYTKLAIDAIGHQLSERRRNS